MQAYGAIIPSFTPALPDIGLQRLAVANSRPASSHQHSGLWSNLGFIALADVRLQFMFQMYAATFQQLVALSTMLHLTLPALQHVTLKHQLWPQIVV